MPLTAPSPRALARAAVPVPRAPVPVSPAGTPTRSSAAAPRAPAPGTPARVPAQPRVNLASALFRPRRALELRTPFSRPVSRPCLVSLRGQPWCRSVRSTCVLRSPPAPSGTPGSPASTRRPRPRPGAAAGCGRRCPWALWPVCTASAGRRPLPPQTSRALRSGVARCLRDTPADAASLRAERGLWASRDPCSGRFPPRSSAAAPGPSSSASLHHAVVLPRTPHTSPGSPVSVPAAVPQTLPPGTAASVASAALPRVRPRGA